MALNLGAMIAKQKEAANGSTNVAATDRTQSSDVAPAASAEQLRQSDSIPSEQIATQPAKPTGLKIGGLAGLKLGGANPTPSTAAGSTGIAGADAAGIDKPVVPVSDGSQSRPVVESRPAAGSSSELAALFESEELGKAPDRVAAPTVMPDLVDVQCPTRNLPADITIEGQDFVNQLNQIYSIAYDPEMMGQFVRVVMQELQEHPEYIQLMAPEDSHVMIAGLRSSMGLAQIKKESKKRSTGTTAGAKKPTKSSEMDALLDGMGGMDFS